MSNPTFSQRRCAVASWFSKTTNLQGMLSWWQLFLPALLVLVSCDGFLVVPLVVATTTTPPPAQRPLYPNAVPRRNEWNKIPPFPVQRRTFHATTATKIRLFRGGAQSSLSLSSFKALFVQFASYIGASRRRCMMLLVCSILLESVSTVLSKKAKDTGSVLVFLQAVCLYLITMVGFNMSLAKINVSVAYALWSAIGTTLITTAGICLFGETIDLPKAIFLTMIVVGVVGLNLKS